MNCIFLSCASSPDKDELGTQELAGTRGSWMCILAFIANLEKNAAWVSTYIFIKIVAYGYAIELFHLLPTAVCYGARRRKVLQGLWFLCLWRLW